jgi:hypothetical protein
LKSANAAFSDAAFPRDVIGHLECELMPAEVFPWEKLIDMGVLDKEV